MQNYRFGIVGAGLIADFHAKAISDIPYAKLVGFCDLDFEKAKRFKPTILFPDDNNKLK